MLSLGGALGPETDGLLADLGAALAHRGPDDEQRHIESAIALVYRRLAIVDVPGGRQPLVSADGSLVAMVNGEIYNHRELRARYRGMSELRTGSDSEVVLPLYREHGLDFLQHLNGMYAIALWDRNAQRLVLARDRLGIKPMHYARIGDQLVFASELKALFVHPDCPRSFDWDAALEGAFGRRRSRAFAPSYFAGCATVPAGSVLVADVRRGTVVTERYWSLPHAADVDDGRTEQHIVDGYREILEDSVDKCLGGDVEAGLFLGGGLDSIAIAALAGRRRRLHTFSVLSPRAPEGGDVCAARQAAGELGLPNHQVLFDPARPISTDAYAAILWACETPWTGPEQICRYHLHRYARSVRPGLKIVLLGHDDLTADVGDDPPDSDDPTWDGFERALRAAERDDLLERLRPGILYADTRFDRPLFSRDSREWLGGLVDGRLRPHAWSLHAESPLDRLPLEHLWGEDRTASANGIEARVPFLDHRLVEFALGIPARFHRTLLWDHVLLRRACAPLVPHGVAVRRKRLDGAASARWILNLLEANDGAILEEAFADGTIDRDAARRIAGDARHDPDGGIAEDLLHVVNMGLLARLARETPRRRVRPDVVELLGSAPPSPWDGERLDARHAFESHVPLALGLDVVLLRPTVDQDDRLFVMVAGVVRHEIDDESFRQVLLRVDGIRTLDEVLRGLGMPERAIRRPLAEALDDGTLRFVPPCSMVAPRMPAAALGHAMI